MDGDTSEARGRAEAFFEVWNTKGVEAAAELFWHPDIVWEDPVHFPDSGVHRGREESVRRMRERFTHVGEVKVEVVDAELLGDQLLIEGIVRGRGSASGAPTEMRDFFLNEIEDGLVVRVREFLDRDEALAAAG